MQRSIKEIYTAEQINMGGILLDQALPIGEVEQVSPFVLIHHWHHRYPGGNRQLELGVGPHPHRGFSPVTFIFKGGVHHRDSLGNSSIITAGGTQWMHAGSGISHSERPDKKIAEKGGEFELIQFWVNEPSHHKMTPPHYFPLTREATPSFQSDDGTITVAVVAGSIQGIVGPIRPNTPLIALRLECIAGGEHTFDITASYNLLLYQLDGELLINGTDRMIPKTLAIFENTDGPVTIQTLQHTRAIILAGEPINEPVATYGPIVMNTHEELLAAFRDLQLGKFGIVHEND